jgi:uracil-DNA glycosylase
MASEKIESDEAERGVSGLDALLGDLRACEICAEHLPRGPRPVVRISETARILIIGQAPSTRVHETGLSWNDRSGDRLRDWLAIDRDTFYDVGKVAIMPMGFCYPGVDKNGGDKPPRKECAPEWHPALWPFLGAADIVLLVGGYAQKYYLDGARRMTVTDTVAAWRDFGPRFVPLPHPSWRNTAWLRRNPWFEEDLLPPLRRRVRALL